MDQNIIHKPELPFLSKIVGEIEPGLTIDIRGTAHDNFTGFIVNIQCGTSLLYDVLLHYKVDFTKQLIEINSMQSLIWSNKETYNYPQQPFNFPINKAGQFCISIMFDPDHFNILTNGQHCTFQHRMPYQRASYLAIEGTITLETIKYMNSPEELYRQLPSALFPSASSLENLPSLIQMALAFNPSNPNESTTPCLDVLKYYAKMHQENSATSSQQIPNKHGCTSVEKPGNTVLNNEIPSEEANAIKNFCSRFSSENLLQYSSSDESGGNDDSSDSDCSDDSDISEDSIEE